MTSPVGRGGSRIGQDGKGGFTVMSGGDNSVDLLTTIDGDNSSYFLNKRVHNMQLEQKDD